jgi:hypothetical protein
VTITGADRLQARFSANSWSGRIEGGYRVVIPLMGGVGITPYPARPHRLYHSMGRDSGKRQFGTHQDLLKTFWVSIGFELGPL